eukprot:TRINITY_DN231_c3_g1_i1.p1 TRINITY_DN231_c3_g1~~TRINITY_DN231_c3_g1_i1.p1  ORF type:complete len:644 (+),score=138.65 TRINITY_DN231_c3_g1_i1:294-2225(+)
MSSPNTGELHAILQRNGILKSWLRCKDDNCKKKFIFNALKMKIDKETAEALRKEFSETEFCHTLITLYLRIIEAANDSNQQSIAMKDSIFQLYEEDVRRTLLNVCNSEVKNYWRIYVDTLSWFQTEQSQSTIWRSIKLCLDEEFVDLLIEKTGLQKSTFVDSMRTPLHDLIINSATATHPLIEEMGALIDEHPEYTTANDRHRRTPLHWACVKGLTDVVLMLIEHQKTISTNNDVNEYLIVVDEDECNALHLAAQNGHSSIVEVLLRLGPENYRRILCNAEQTALLMASDNGHTLVVRALLKDNPVNYRLNTDNMGFTSLHVACELGYIDVVKALLECDDENEIHSQLNMLVNEMTALMIAAENGHPKIVKYLMDIGPPNYREVEGRWGYKAIHQASDPKSAELLLEGTEPEYREAVLPEIRCNALHAQVEHDNVEAVKALLKGSRPEFRRIGNRYGYTPLHLASSVEMVEVLLEGMDYNYRLIKDNEGGISLHSVCFRGDEHAVRALLKDTPPEFREITNNEGFTPLHLAAQDRKLEVVKVLLEGCNEGYANIQCGCGHTAAYYAFSYEEFGIVHEILGDMYIRKMVKEIVPILFTIDGSPDENIDMWASDSVTKHVAGWIIESGDNNIHRRTRRTMRRRYN